MRRIRQSTPVSARRRDAASFFREEAEGPEGAAGDESEELDANLLRDEAAAVIGCLETAAPAIDDTEEEQVRIFGESQDCLGRCGVFLQRMGLEEGDQGEAQRRREEVGQEGLEAQEAGGGCGEEGIGGGIEVQEKGAPARGVVEAKQGGEFEELTQSERNQ